VRARRSPDFYIARSNWVFSLHRPSGSRERPGDIGRGHSIGSQNIISVTGEGNNVNGEQSASNTGAISTKSDITTGEK
jgi:hypothetical protein